MEFFYTSLQLKPWSYLMNARLIVWVINQLTYGMLFESGIKQEYPERTTADAGRAYKFHMQRRKEEGCATPHIHRCIFTLLLCFFYIIYSFVDWLEGTLWAGRSLWTTCCWVWEPSRLSWRHHKRLLIAKASQSGRLSMMEERPKTPDDLRNITADVSLNP